MNDVLKGIASRGTVYKQLSRGFLYPRQALLSDLASGIYQETLARAAEELGLDCSIELDVVQEGDLTSEYVYYFDMGKLQPPCAPYGGLYLGEVKRSTILLHLSEIYKNFGLDVAAQPNELQDHLSVELEFMYFLCFKEAQAVQAGESQLAGYRKAQEDFLDRHFTKWLPKFAETIEQKCRSKFYGGLTAFCHEFVNFDASWCARRE